MAETAVSRRERTVDRPALPADLAATLRPLTLAGRSTLPVPEVLTPLFPWGGVVRGSRLAVGGDAAWSLALAVLADALGPEGWVAVVGVPDLGLVAAAELGVRLDRVLIVETPPLARWATVVASLLEAVDVVAVAPGHRVGRRDGRRLAARLRESRSVLLHLDGASTWPDGVDLSLTATTERWQGLGEGHGCLRGRRVQVTATGRRSSGRPVSVDVALPGADGRLGPAPVEPLPFPGAVRASLADLGAGGP